MSGEYGLKKDRDRKYFAGQFLWSGIDYIGEPTPYDVFPVKSSFFGAVDTAGFPKDMYYLFRSQWTSEPMVHLLPMNWTDHEPGETVQVWAYANVDTVELFLNGQSLGVRRFDHKTTTDGRPYLETTEATRRRQDRHLGPVPGQLHEPERQRRQAAPDLERAVRARQARRGRPPATATRSPRDEVDTAGRARTPCGSRPTSARSPPTARSLSYVTADVVDAHGVLVPDADNAITFDVTRRRRLVGLDNGREESAENYKARRAHGLQRQGAGDRRAPATGPGRSR